MAAQTLTSTSNPTSTATTRLLTTSQAAAKLNVSEEFLSADRCTRRHGIVFCRLGRAVRYRESDLDRWIERNLVCGEVA